MNSIRTYFHCAKDVLRLFRMRGIAQDIRLAVFCLTTLSRQIGRRP